MILNFIWLLWPYHWSNWLKIEKRSASPNAKFSQNLHIMKKIQILPDIASMRNQSKSFKLHTFWTINLKFGINYFIPSSAHIFYKYWWILVKFSGEMKMYCIYTMHMHVGHLVTYKYILFSKKSEELGKTSVKFIFLRFLQFIIVY